MRGGGLRRFLAHWDRWLRGLLACLFLIVECMAPAQIINPQFQGIVLARKGRKAFTGIMVTANVKRVMVFANDIFVGTGGEYITLSPGTHQLVFSAEGYRDVKQTLQIKSGQALKLTVRLKKKEAPKPKPRPKPKSNVRSAPSRQVAKQPGNTRRPQRPTSLDTDAALPAPRVALPNSQPQYVAPQPQYVAPQPQYVQPQPQYIVPQPQYVQPQYVMPQPQYVQPVPQYVAPQPQYMAPQPQYSSPTDFLSEPKPARRRPSSRRTSEGGGGSSFLAILPLGVGQFQNGEPVKGAVIMSAQIGGVGWAVYNMIKLNDFNALVQESLDTETAEDGYDEDQIIGYRKSMSMNQYVGWGVFAGAWVVGVIDAFVNIEDEGRRRRADFSPEPNWLLASPTYRNDHVLWRTGLIATPQGHWGLGLQARF